MPELVEGPPPALTPDQRALDSRYSLHDFAGPNRPQVIAASQNQAPSLSCVLKPMHSWRAFVGRPWFEIFVFSSFDLLCRTSQSTQGTDSRCQTSATFNEGELKIMKNIQEVDVDDAPSKDSGADIEERDSGFDQAVGESSADHGSPHNGRVRV